VKEEESMQVLKKVLDATLARRAALLATAALLILSAIAFGAAPAAKPAPAEVAGAHGAVTASPLTGDWPKQTPEVTLDLEGDTIAEAVRSIADQTGWDLVLRDPDRAAETVVTVRLRHKPASVALTTVLSASPLTANLHDGVLTIEGVATGKPEAPGQQDAGALHVRMRHRSEGKHHGDDRVVIGQPLKIEADENVGDAVVVGGPLTVAGHVHGDAVAVGGSVDLQAGAVVDGDAVAVGGPINVDPAAVLHGNRVGVAGTFGGVAKGLMGRLSHYRNEHAWPWHFLSFGSTLIRAITTFVLALLLLVFMPDRVTRVRTYLAEKPGAATLGGLAILVGFVPMLVMLAITIIGIALIPFAILAVVALVVIGLTAFLVWLGEKIPLFAGKKTLIGAMTLGLVTMMFVDFVPILGKLAIFAVGLVGAGAALLSRLGQAAKASPAAPAGAATTA